MKNQNHSYRIQKIELIRWYNKNYCLKRVKQHPSAIQFVKNQTKEICIEAIKLDGNSLKYIKEPSEELCLEAVRQNKNAIQYVDIKKFPKVFELYQFLTM
jgi:hypothetical protein